MLKETMHSARKEPIEYFTNSITIILCKAVEMLQLWINRVLQIQNIKAVMCRVTEPSSPWLN